MLAVIKTGGKQYVVKVGDTLQVEKLASAAGQIGTPVLEKAVVKAEVVKIFRDEKILVFKKKRRKQYRRTRGHRQTLTEVKILAIYPDKTAVPAEELKVDAPPAVAPKAEPKPNKPRVVKPKPESKPEPEPAAKPVKGKAVKPAAKPAKAEKPKPKKAAK
jgi:large subunit ribosomal protein L21